MAKSAGMVTVLKLFRRGISLRLVDYSEKEQREMEEERGGYL
jgi:hypothetical protein